MYALDVYHAALAKEIMITKQLVQQDFPTRLYRYTTEQKN